MMRAFALLLALLLGAAGAQAAITKVANNSNGNGGSGATVAVTMSGLVAGGTIMVGIGWCADASCVTTGSITITGVTDTNGNSFSAVPSTISGTVVKRAIWAATNVNNNTSTSDAITVTASSSGAFYLEAYASEYTGVALASVTEGGNTAAGTGTAVSATSGSTSLNGDLIYSMAGAVSGSLTPNQTNVGNGGQDQFQIATTPGTYTNTYTGSVSSPWAESIVALKPEIGLPRNLIGVGR